MTERSASIFPWISLLTLLRPKVSTLVYSCPKICNQISQRPKKLSTNALLLKKYPKRELNFDIWASLDRNKMVYNSFTKVPLGFWCQLETSVPSKIFSVWTTQPKKLKSVWNGSFPNTPTWIKRISCSQSFWRSRAADGWKVSKRPEVTKKRNCLPISQWISKWIWPN